MGKQAHSLRFSLLGLVSAEGKKEREKFRELMPGPEAEMSMERGHAVGEDEMEHTEPKKTEAGMRKQKL